MQAKRVMEIREVVGSPDFEAWYARYRDLRRGIDEGQAEREALLRRANVSRFESELRQQEADDTLFFAGECEDLAARALATLSELENESFEVLSDFEVRRQEAIAASESLDRSEALLEGARQCASDLRAQRDAAAKAAGGPAEAEAERFKTRLREAELEVVELAAQVEEATAAQRRADEHRDALWSDVEGGWSEAFEATMARTEHAYRSRRVRRRAEELFLRATVERRQLAVFDTQSAKCAAVVDEATEALEQHLQDGRSRFGCTLVEEFLFWPKVNDPHVALCVPLIDEPEHFNIQVTALQVYEVERARGLEFIEPVAETEEAVEDPRLAAFFDRSRMIAV